MFSRSRLAIKIALKFLLSPVGFLVPGSGKGLRVLFYHRVNAYSFSRLGMVSREITVQPAAFEKQLAWLARRGFRSLKLSEFEDMLTGAAEIDPKAVLITFDDGYADNLEIAAPLLEKYGFTALVFVVTEMIGGNNRSWPMSDPTELGRFMDTDALRQWLARGHEIGSHTCSHPVLTRLNDDACLREMREARHEIEKKI